MNPVDLLRIPLILVCLAALAVGVIEVLRAFAKGRKAEDWRRHVRR